MNELIDEIASLREKIKKWQEQAGDVGAMPHHVLLADTWRLLGKIEAALPQWRDVREELPEPTHKIDGRDISVVLGCDDVGEVTAVYFDKQSGKWAVGGAIEIYAPKYWMPLPKPPKEEQ